MDAFPNGLVFDGGPTSGSETGLAVGLSLLLDELAYGVLVAERNGRICHANQAARHELGRFSTLGVSDHLLRTHTFEDEKTLQDALMRVAEGKRSLITLTGNGDARLTLAVLPLGAGLTAVRAALVFARASVCESLMLCFFARNHGLTTTEEHVLGILCQGYSSPEIARQMKVAVSTVRSHVRSLCAKTRSSGIRELVNRVAVLPPVAPSLRYEQMH